MRKISPILIFIGVIIPLVAWAAAATLNSSGNWSNSGIWDSGNIAEDISEDVDWDNNIGEVIIQNTESYTTSNQSMNNGNALTINSGGSLIIGASGNAQNLSTGNTAIINVYGDLTIWGDLDVGNTLTLNVTGTLTIKGDINMGNDGELDISGNVSVEGDFNGGNNTDLNVDGNLDVDGNIDTGNGSDLTGSGTMSSGGCTGDPDFCSGAPLPIKLIYFEGISEENHILLEWTSATEENFDFYTVQKSINGLEFEDLGKVEGLGGIDRKYEYRFVDEVPVPGINYYRLKAVDLDGTIEYHDIIGVNYEGEVIDGFKMYPNPSNDGFITIKSIDGMEKGIVEIYDNYGLMILREEINTLAKTIQVPQSVKGTVIVRLRTNNSVVSQRLVLK